MLSSIVSGLCHPHGSSILDAAVRSIIAIKNKRRHELLQYAISLTDKSLSDGHATIALCRLSYLLFSPEEARPHGSVEATDTCCLFWKVIKRALVADSSSDNALSLASYTSCAVNQASSIEKKFFSTALLSETALTTEMLIAAAANLHPALFCEYVLIQLPDAYKDESLEMLDVFKSRTGLTQTHLTDILAVFPENTLTDNEISQLKTAITEISTTEVDIGFGIGTTPLLPVLSKLLSKARSHLKEHPTMYSSSKGNPLLRVLHRLALQLDSQQQLSTIPGPWLMIKIVLAAAYSVKLQNKIWSDTLLRHLLCFIPALDSKYARILGLCAFVYIATSYDTDASLHAALAPLTIDDIKIFLTKLEEWMKLATSSIVIRTLAFQSVVSIMGYVESQDQIMIIQLAPSILSVAAGIHHNIGTFMNMLNAFAAEIMEFQGSAILSTLLNLQAASLSGVSGLLRVADDIKSSPLQASTPLTSELYVQTTFELVQKEKYGSKYGLRLLSSALFQCLLNLHKTLSINVLSFYRFIGALECFLLTCCNSTSNGDSGAILFRALETESIDEGYNTGTSSGSSSSSHFSTIIDAYLSAGEHLFGVISTIYDLSSGLSSSLKNPTPPKLLPSTLKRLNELSIPPDTFGYAEFFIVTATARVLAALYLQDLKMMTSKIRAIPKKSKTASIALLMGMYIMSDIPEFCQFSPDCASFLNSILPVCISIPLGKRKYRDAASSKYGGSPYHSSTNIIEEIGGTSRQSSLTYLELSYSIKHDSDSLRFHRMSLVLAHILHTALSKRLCDSVSIDDYLLILVYISTGVFSSPDSSIESMETGISDIDDVEQLFMSLTTSWLGPEPICKALIVFLFSNNMPLSLRSECPGMLHYSTWNAKFIAIRLLNSTLDLLPESARREIIVSSRLCFHRVLTILTEMLLLPIQSHIPVLLSFLSKISESLLVRGNASSTSILESSMTFPDEPIELIEHTRKSIDSPGRTPKSHNYIYCLYRSASGADLFSYSAVLNDNSPAISLYEYLRMLITAHIKRLQDKIDSGAIALLPLEKHAIQQFFTEKRSSALSFSQMFPGMRFLGHSAQLIVSENLYAYFCGENAELYQESYTYWYDCFILDLLFNTPDVFTLKLFNEYDKIKQIIGQQIKDRKKTDMPFGDACKTLTHFIYTYGLLFARRLLHVIFTFSLERTSSLQSILSNATSLSTTEPTSRVDSMLQISTSPGVGLSTQGSRDSALSEQDKRYHVEINIAITSFWDIFDWAKDKNAFSVRTIMHFGQCISAVSSSVLLTMVTICEQRGQSTAASVLLKCYADSCNAEQYYRPIAKLDESVAAAERIKMVVPKMTSTTYQLEQCCKALLYFASNKSYLLLIDTTAYVLDALLRLPAKLAESTTAQVLMNLLGYVILYSGLPRLGRSVLESPFFHRSTSNISKLADAPSYSSLYKANVDSIADFLNNKTVNIHSSLFVSYPVHPVYRRLAAYSTALTSEIIESYWNSSHLDSVETDYSCSDETFSDDTKSNRITVSTRLAQHCVNLSDTQHMSESILNDSKRHQESDCNHRRDVSAENLLSPETDAIVYQDNDETQGSSSVFDAECDAIHTISRRGSVFRNAKALRHRSLSATNDILSGDLFVYQALTESITGSKNGKPHELGSAAASFVNFLRDDSRCSPPNSSRTDTNTTKQIAELRRLGYFHMSAISSMISIMQLIDLPSEARALILGKVCLCITLYESSPDHREFFREYLANRIIRLLLLVVEQKPQISTVIGIVLMFSICSKSKQNMSSVENGYHANLDKLSGLPILQPLSAAMLSYFLSLAPHILLQSIYGRYALQRAGLLNSYNDFIGFRQLYHQCIGYATNLDTIFEFVVLWCDSAVWFHALKMLLVGSFINTLVESDGIAYKQSMLRTDGDLSIRIRNLTFIHTVDDLANGTMYRVTVQLLMTFGEHVCIRVILYLIAKCTLPLHGYKVGRILYSFFKSLSLKKPHNPEDTRPILSILCQICNAISHVSSLSIMGILSVGLVPLFRQYPELIVGILSDKYASYQSPCGSIFPRQYGLLEPQEFIIRLLEQRTPEFNIEACLVGLRSLAHRKELDGYAIPGFRRNYSEMKLALFELLLSKCRDFISMGPYLSRDYEKDEIVSTLIYIYHTICPPLDSSDKLSCAQYRLFIKLLFEKKDLYNSLLQLAVYVGHMSWDRLSQDSHKVRKYFIYSVMGISVLSEKMDTDKYNEFITALEALKLGSGPNSPLIIPLGYDSPGFFELSLWMYQVLVIFWEYTSYKCEFRTDLQSTFQSLKSIKNLPVWEQEGEGADYVDSTDADIPIEKLIASLSLSISPQTISTVQSSTITSSVLITTPINNQQATSRIRRPIKLNNFGLLDCSMLCLLLIIGSNKKRVLDYAGVIIDCYEWASSTVATKKPEKGLALSLTLYASLFLLSSNKQIVPNNSTRIFASTCQLINTLYTISQQGNHQFIYKEGGTGTQLTGKTIMLADLTTSTVSDKFSLGHLHPEQMHLDKSLGSMTVSSLGQHNSVNSVKTEMELSNVPEHVNLTERSTVYGYDIPIITTPYLLHLIHCVTAFTEGSSTEPLLAATKSLLLLTLRHSQVRRLLPELATLLDLTKHVIKKDTQFILLHLIPSASVLVCYQTAVEANVTHKVLSTLAFLVDMEWGEDKASIQISDALVCLYSHVYTRPNAETHGLLAFFSKIMISGETSSYTKRNLLKLLTSLVERSLFAQRDVLSIIEKILRDVDSESVAAQCLLSASVLLGM